MADERSGLSSGQITVALIGAAAVLGSALIANSDRLFGSRVEAERTALPLAGPAPSPAPSSSSSSSSTPTIQPAVAQSGPPPADIAPPAPPPATFSMTGGWQAEDGFTWQFRQDGDRFVAAMAEGAERVEVQAYVSGQSIRMSADYFNGGSVGLRMMTCEGYFINGGRQLQMSCLNPQTNITSRPTWSRT